MPDKTTTTAKSVEPTRSREEAEGKLANQHELVAPEQPVQPDWCAICAQLRDAYYSLISGGMANKILTRSLDAQEEIGFSRINIDVLKPEMDKACSFCEAINGLATLPRRFAISAYHKMRCCKSGRP